jgi:Domain of unknown function (DUF5615)
VKLLLDELYSPTIAAQLRNRGHDVQSVSERDDLRGIADRELLSRAGVEGRALLTENVADFMPLVHEAASAGESHASVVFTSPHSMPRGAGTIGMYIEALDRFLRERPGPDGLANQVAWLAPP